MVQESVPLCRHLGPRLWDQLPRQRKWPSGDKLHQQPQLAQTKKPCPASLASLKGGRQDQAQIGKIRVLVGRAGLEFAAQSHHPQTGNGQSQPQSSGTSWIGHSCLLPLPATTLVALESLFTPGPQSIPCRIAAFGRQISQDEPRFFVSRTPVGNQSALQLTLGGRKRGTLTPPHTTLLVDQFPQPIPARLTSRAKLAPWLIRRNGCHPRRTMRRYSQRAYRPRSARTSTVQSFGMAGRNWRNIRSQ
jgi:hypothetical protein